MKKKNINKGILTKLIIIMLLLSLTLVGCRGNENDNGKEINNDSEVENVVTDTHEEIIDEDTQLVHDSSLELKYAKSFSVDYYKGGYKTITDWTGRKTLLVPEGKEVPQVKENVNVVVTRQIIPTQ